MNQQWESWVTSWPVWASFIPLSPQRQFLILNCSGMLCLCILSACWIQQGFIFQNFVQYGFRFQLFNMSYVLLCSIQVPFTVSFVESLTKRMIKTEFTSAAVLPGMAVWYSYWIGMPLQKNLQCNFRNSFVACGHLHVPSSGSCAEAHVTFRIQFPWGRLALELSVFQISCTWNCNTLFIITQTLNEVTIK